MSFWCLQFLPENKQKMSHSSKNEFICCFFGRIHGLTICFQINMTFKLTKYKFSSTLPNAWYLIFLNFRWSVIPFTNQLIFPVSILFSLNYLFKIFRLSTNMQILWCHLFVYWQSFNFCPLKKPSVYELLIFWAIVIIRTKWIISWMPLSRWKKERKKQKTSV